MGKAVEELIWYVVPGAIFLFPTALIYGWTDDLNLASASVATIIVGFVLHHSFRVPYERRGAFFHRKRFIIAKILEDMGTDAPKHRAEFTAGAIMDSACYSDDFPNDTRDHVMRRWRFKFSMACITIASWSAVVIVMFLPQHTLVGGWANISDTARLWLSATLLIVGLMTLLHFLHIGRLIEDWDRMAFAKYHHVFESSVAIWRSSSRRPSFVETPTILEVGGYRFSLFLRDESRLLVHVQHDSGEAKFWLCQAWNLPLTRALTSRLLTT